MSKDGSLRLHPKFGVNPSMGQCAWCGKENGEVVLLGWNGGKEAPRMVVTSYEPCAKCVATQAQGITFIECEDHATEIATMEVNSNVFWTGRWAVVREEAVRRWPLDDGTKNAMLTQRRAFIRPADAKLIGLFDEHPATTESLH